MLDVALEGGHESAGGFAVQDPVIERERDTDALASDDLAVDNVVRP